MTPDEELQLQNTVSLTIEKVQSDGDEMREMREQFRISRRCLRQLFYCYEHKQCALVFNSFHMLLLYEKWLICITCKCNVKVMP